MRRRVISRSLLSSLLIWQLLASALAHPVRLADNVERTMTMTQNVDGHAGCAHVAHHQTSIHINYPCHSVCKCPCAGTAALAPALPTMIVAVPDHDLSAPGFNSIVAPPVANLLRPPIA